MRAHVAVFVTAMNRIVAEADLDAGASIIVGSEPGCTVLTPAELGIAGQLVVEEGRLLHVLPGMRIHVCDDDCSDRLKGEYAELTAAGLQPPLPLRWTRLNIRLRPGVSVFVRYEPSSSGEDGEPARRDDPPADETAAEGMS